MINKFSKFGILLFLLVVLAVNSFGQNKCNLQIGVYEFKEDGSSEQFPVRDAKIKLVNNKTKKSLKISKNTNIPTISDAFEGEYEITVSKNGFQKTLETLSPDCSLANDQNTVSEFFFLCFSSCSTVELLLIVCKKNK